MKKVTNWIWDNVLFLGALFLLVFIPLYPKIPLVDVQNVWVYIRLEDFAVLFIILAWIILLLKRKISLKTPLTVPILIFWIVGAISTFHGVLLIFPDLSNVFPNVAFFSLLRHIEYLSLFFIGFHGFNDKKHLNVVIAILLITLLGVIAYGFGQKYFGFPAFLTGNEEFAKGIPIQLSSLSRVPSTFAGHYDLAAYLVLIVPIMLSLFFGFRNILLKLIFLIASALGIVMMVMTVSRISFAALFLSLFVVLFFQKRKLFFISLPLVVILGVLMLSFQPSLLDRFRSTVSEVNVIVDARTGASIGHVKFVPKEDLKDKIIIQKRVKDSIELSNVLTRIEKTGEESEETPIFPYKLVPEIVPLVTAVNISTGEDLPQGTAYINLPLSPVTQKYDQFFYELSPEIVASTSAQIMVFNGQYLVKKASAYDLSFTTRFQGQWPNAIDTFKKNILIGSGYGSVGLAVDNNYLRMLGEIGLIGIGAFALLFISLAIYIRRVFPDIESRVAKSFIIGYGAGLIGLGINATLIDVFEASKIAFIMWLLFGIVVSLLAMYQKKEINLLHEFKKLAASKIAVIALLLFLTIVVFSPSIANFFVADDFTWFRWAAQCGEGCNPFATIVNYFTQSDGFFYRPGTKLYFLVMFKTFWLNQSVYHLVSIFLHFSVATLLFILARRIFKSNFLAASSAVLFLLLSGATESVFWISTTGHLLNVVFGILGVLLFVWWTEKNKLYLLIASILSIFVSLLFHESGIVYPFLIIAYVVVFGKTSGIKSLFARWDLYVLFAPVIIYLIARYFAQSHWFSGDYSYDVINLPFNIVGNLFGYFVLTLTGPISLPIYTTIREIMRENILFALILIPIGLVVSYFAYKYFAKYFSQSEKKVILFGLLFFVVSLIPFIGLGNITSRYSYLASFGVIIILVIIGKKIFVYLKSIDRNITIGITTLVLLVFVLFHIIQVQQAFFDWNDAGKKVQRFYLSVDNLYSNSWTKENVKFYIVNRPIKNGEAWVFPVGLEDALWLTTRNDRATIIYSNSVEEAKAAAGLDPDSHILVFNEDGSLTEIIRFKPNSKDLINSLPVD